MKCSFRIRIKSIRICKKSGNWLGSETMTLEKKIGWPKKGHFWVLKKKKISSIFFFCFYFKNYRSTNVILVSIFLYAQKTIFNCQKCPKWHFWRSIIFLCFFKNTDKKSICASFVFKAGSKPKHEENICLVGFLQKPKTCFSGVQNGPFIKSNFKFLFLRLLFSVKGSFMPIFTKNVNIWAPCKFLKMKTLTRVLYIIVLWNKNPKLPKKWLTRSC